MQNESQFILYRAQRTNVNIVAFHCKGLDQSNIVCEYEVNLSTNEKVITEKQNLTQIVKEQC